MVGLSSPLKDKYLFKYLYCKPVLLKYKLHLDLIYIFINIIEYYYSYNINIKKKNKLFL